MSFFKKQLKRVLFCPFFVLSLFSSTTLAADWAYSADRSPDVDEAGFVAALRAALAYHPSVRGKAAEVAAKGYAINAAKTGRYPTLSAQMSYEKVDADEDRADSLGTLRLQQPLWAFGKIDRAIVYAELDEQAEKGDLQAVKRQLLKRTALAYARVEVVRQKIEVETNNVVILGKLHAKIDRRREGKLASDIDLQLVHSRLIQAKAKRMSFKAELGVAEVELAALTRTKISSVTAVDRHLLLASDISENSLAALTEQTLRQSATLHYNESLIVLARQEKALAQVSEMPTFSLQVEHRFLDEANTNVDKTRALLVFESSLEGMGFLSYANTQGANARVRAAQYALLDSRQELIRQVANLYQNRLLQQQLAVSIALAIKNLEAVSQSYVRQYEAGRKSWLEVLNMNRELNEQRLQWVEANNSQLVYTLELMALGNRLSLLVEDEVL